MKELSLHILDIVQNSISAGSSIIKVTIDEDTATDKLVISIEDDGKGMDKQAIEKVKDPFYTSRSTRKVGLGIPLFLAAAKRCEGDLYIESEPRKGTKVIVQFKHSHIDRAPIGNMWDTMAGLILCNENLDFIYEHKYDNKVFSLSTVDLKNTLKEVPITSPEVAGWIREYLRENIKDLYGGVSFEDNSGIGRNKEEDS